MKEKIFNLAIIFFLLAAIVNGIPLGKHIIEKNRNSLLLESLEAVIQNVENVSSTTAESLVSAPAHEPEAPFLGYKLLYEQNQDLAGWINIPDSNINYPVMKSKESEFYLYHNFKKEPSKYGTPFIDENCDIDSSCGNIIIYGHHMKDGSMFTDLMKYQNRSYYQEHPTILFDTLTHSYEYEIIGILNIPAIESESSFYRHLMNSIEGDYNGLLSELRKRSLYDTESAITGSGSLLTLITCEYSQSEGRLLIIARQKASQ